VTLVKDLKVLCWHKTTCFVWHRWYRVNWSSLIDMGLNSALETKTSYIYRGYWYITGTCLRISAQWHERKWF